jgi:hypothetical protein
VVKQQAVPPALAADYLWSISGASRNISGASRNISGAIDSRQQWAEITMHREDQLDALGLAVLAYLQQQKRESKQEDSWLAFLQQAVATIEFIAKSASPAAAAGSSRQQQGEPASSSSQQPEQPHQPEQPPGQPVQPPEQPVQPPEQPGQPPEQPQQQDPAGVYYFTNRKEKERDGMLVDFSWLQDTRVHCGQITRQGQGHPHQQQDLLRYLPTACLGLTPSWHLCTLQELPSFAEQQLLVFIHGFATSFQSAVRSAARLALHMNHGGPVLVYSWASWGSWFWYSLDKKHVTAAVQPLRELLRDLDAQVRCGNQTQVQRACHQFNGYMLNVVNSGCTHYHVTHSSAGCTDGQTSCDCPTAVCRERGWSWWRTAWATKR